MTLKKKILIVGGVAGGASAAARLRRLDEFADITLIERGKDVSFAHHEFDLRPPTHEIFELDDHLAPGSELWVPLGIATAWAIFCFWKV